MKMDREHDKRQGVLPGDDEKDLVERLLSATRGIRYGAVEVIIHDSKVVQIERKERYRLEDRAAVAMR